MGRLPVVATLSELDEEALMTILSQPKNALVKQYQHLFELEGVELEFSPESLREAAKLALERKTGARGLRSILESALLDCMYELPTRNDVVKVVMDAPSIRGETAPLMVLKKKSWLKTPNSSALDNERRSRI